MESYFGFLFWSLAIGSVSLSCNVSPVIRESYFSFQTVVSCEKIMSTSHVLVKSFRCMMENSNFDQKFIMFGNATFMNQVRVVVGCWN